MLLLNLVLALVWMGLTGDFSFWAFTFGFLAGTFAIGLAQAADGRLSYVRRLYYILELSLFFLYELIVANVKLSVEVMTPKFNMTPGIIAVPLDVKTDLEIILFANLLTLTPGTLTVDVSPDRKFLFVHCVYITDPEAARRELKHGFERRIKRLRLAEGPRP